MDAGLLHAIRKRSSGTKGRFGGNAERRTPNAERPTPNAQRRMQIADCRLQIADFGGTRVVGGESESVQEGAMGRNLVSCWGLSVAAIVLAWHSAAAGERKAAGSRHAEAAARPLVAAAQLRSAGENHAGGMRAMHGRSDLSGAPVRPLETRLSPGVAGGGLREKAATPRHERKGITFFRLNPKFGDVSVQPVIGGVNGAQVSVGF
jgi:hypothetical protein